jgi:photosynthetic reaction center cytochrome c subunit
MSTISKTARLVGALGLALATAACWEAPPMESQQLGYRGLGLEQVTNPRLASATADRSRPPEVDPPAETGGPRVSQLPQYSNIQVLGDLNEAQFLRVMAHMTASVAPQEGADAGCAYCHNLDNLADGSKYQFQVARRMLQMTRAINTTWTNHVGQTGVTCYTCHRGRQVPEYVWYSGPAEPERPGAGYRGVGQNLANPQVGLTSLPGDPFSQLLALAEEIRVVGTAPMASEAQRRPSIQSTEATYGLMMHMSEALGVNCVFCHNSRSFASWETSPPQRTGAFHGIRMTREINATFIQPLQPVFPANRLGPLGDPAKVSCATCHQGVRRPMNGAPMLQSYPELGPPRPAPQAGATPPRG